MKPGMASRPRRSTTRVREPTQRWISLSLPTAAMRSPRTAIACARGCCESTVKRSPWRRTRSARGCCAAAPVAVARGVDTLHRSVGGHDSLLVALPLDVSLRGILAAGNAVVGYGMVPYRLVGDITADTPIGSRQIPFDQRGEFAAVRVR